MKQVSRNIFGTMMAWVRGRASITRATSASRAPRLAQLRIHTSHGKVKLIATAVFPLTSQIHWNRASPRRGMAVASASVCGCTGVGIPELRWLGIAAL
jgi:hypothetical protein